MDSHLPAAPTKTLGHYFSENLNAVLAVGGKQRESGRPGPITASCIQRQTGIARSTLRALKSPQDHVAPNPDLHTLARIAKVLGVPPAFLLMRPQDWLALGQAVGGSSDYLAAAVKLQSEDKLALSNPIENILRECKVHPDVRPIGVGASPEVGRVNARDEWRRRNCLKLDALMLRQVRAAQPRAWLAAIAGALVSDSTPHTPTNID
ncbi:helix-turn-helix transcriptional regulator [Pseudomonas putida]|uniref:helix-turn-helix domain-containing protein n=1 Tax=Pseudomonas putida TaxID=303 RepID=UPI0007716F9D|nr:helix-turn-helix transcriptional regulator [Pseudomonas putida]KWW14586.1 XRE family transcriptional regulator [Pseudomonas putida]MDQ2488010.1 helix-turn-helix transcriptional regulator [Pseudomonas putida]